MATVFTHALVGAAIAGASSARAGRLRLCLAAAALAVLPDLDVVAFRLGIPYEHPLGHRGFSHSLLFALVAGGLVAPLAAAGRRAGERVRVALVLALATASHGVLDAFTDAGLGVGFLIPLSNERFFAPWRPLATSPLGVEAFFGGPALAILANEVVHVWVPTAVVVWLWARARGNTAR